MELTFNSIYYTKVGHGPHLCFLHGYCEDQHIWEPVIEKLSNSYTCVAIDLPGFGKSAQTNFKSLPKVAKQVNELLHHEKTTDTIMFGHSMGGYVVAEYIHQFGIGLKAAAFIHSTSLADSEEKKKKRSKTIDFIVKNGSKSFFPIFVDGLVTPTNIDALRADLLTMVTITPNQSIIDGHTAMMQREDRLQSISKFNKPILFLRGEEDDHYGPHETYLEASNCQLAQISSIADVAHLSMFEDTEACIKAINTFLQFTKYI